MPSSRISRSTVQRATSMPSPQSVIQIFRAPKTRVAEAKVAHR
jgi:hypothetical protein